MLDKGHWKATTADLPTLLAEDASADQKKEYEAAVEVHLKANGFILLHLEPQFVHLVDDDKSCKSNWNARVNISGQHSV